MNTQSTPALPADSPFASSRAKAAEDAMRKYATSEKPTEWQVAERWDMAWIHILVITTLKQVYAWAPQATEDGDLANYLAYTEAVFCGLWQHHSGEEQHVFPIWMKHAGDRAMEINIEQHLAFEPAVAALWQYVRACRAELQPAPPFPSLIAELPEGVTEHSSPADFGLNPSEGFKPSELRRVMDGAIIPLMEHLAAELETLTPEYMDKVGKAGLDEAHVETRKSVQSYDPAWFLCTFYSALPIEVCKAILALPWFVRRLMIPFMWSGKYSGLWKYAPYPQNLTFWGTA